MKILLLSDLHNEFGFLVNPSDKYETEADVIVLAGDIHIGVKGLQWALDVFDKSKRIIYITGNHEYYENDITEVDKELKELASNSDNATFLNGDKVTIDNVRFLGGCLWTDFNLMGTHRNFGATKLAARSMNDYRVVRKDGKRLEPNDTINIHKTMLASVIEELERPFTGKTVLISHHLLSEQSVTPKYKGDELNTAYASNLEYLMRDYNIDVAMHGHVHSSHDYMCYNTRVVANPRGYYRHEENPDFNKQFIIEI